MWCTKIHKLSLEQSLLPIVFGFGFSKIVFIEVEVIIGVLQSLRGRGCG
jgi:hypothetical protein